MTPAPGAYKCLTICQPYAHLIASGVKRVENRTWPTDYRGPLLIHAGKSREWYDADTLAEYGLAESDLAFGAIVAVAELVGCPRLLAIRRNDYAARWPWLNDHDHTEGPVCWVLEGARRLERPIPYRGAQGLFDVPATVLEGVAYA
jgi:activating signal cointegrator 1